MSGLEGFYKATKEYEKRYSVTNTDQKKNLRICLLIIQILREINFGQQKFKNYMQIHQFLYFEKKIVGNTDEDE